MRRVTMPPTQPDSALSPRRSVRWQAGLFLLAILFAALTVRALQRPASDFAVFHAAGARFIAGDSLYVTTADAPYRYAPGVAALFAPLALLSFGTAKAIWIGATALLALGAAWFVGREHRGSAPLAVAVAWICLLQPLAQELAHGQVDVAVLVLALGAFAAEDRRHPLAAGTLVALASGLKVAPAVLGLDWLLRRRWHLVAGCGAGAALLALPVLARYGVAGAWQQHVAWYRTQSADAGGMIQTGANQSLWAWAASVGAGAWLGAVLAAALIAVAVTDGAPRRRREVLLASVPLVSAYGWPQLFVTSFPLLASTLAARGAAAWVAGCAAAGFTLLSYDVAGPAVEAWAQLHRFLGALLLVVVIAGRLAPDRYRRSTLGPP